MAGEDRSGQLGSTTGGAPVHRRSRRRRLLFALMSLLAVLVLGDLTVRGVLALRGRPVGELSARYRSGRRFRQQGQWQLYDANHPYLPYVLRPNLDLTIIFDNAIPTGIPGTNYPNPQGYREIPLHLVTNSAGLRGPEVRPEKPTDGFRVVCLGGSTTQGYYEDGDTYPRQLETMLRRRLPGRTVEVLNAGVQGYSTAESLVNFEFRLLPYRPDVVIVYHGMNDLKASLAPGFRSDYAHWRRDLLPPRPLVVDRLPAWLDVSAIYVLSREAVLARSRKTQWQRSLYDAWPDFQSDLAGLQAFRSNLRSLVAVARGSGVSPVLATFYYWPMVDTPEARKTARGISSQNEVVCALGRELSVPVADIAQEMPRDASLTFDGIHFTPEGNRVRAEILLRTLEQSGIISPRVD